VKCLSSLARNRCPAWCEIRKQERAQVAELARQVQQTTAQAVKLAFVDQGYTGDTTRQAAHGEGIELQIIKLPEAKKGFVLLPRRWIVERSFG
jgi:transposase